MSHPMPKFANAADHLLRIGTVIEETTGKRLPLYSTHGYINTLEGWLLYGICRDNGDMRPYEAAKAAWKEANAHVAS